MADAATKLPLKSVDKSVDERAEGQAWRPFKSLRQEIDRLFDEFDHGFRRTPFRRSTFDVEPFWHRELSWGGVPAVEPGSRTRVSLFPSAGGASSTRSSASSPWVMTTSSSLMAPVTTSCRTVLPPVTL